MDKKRNLNRMNRRDVLKSMLGAAVAPTLLTPASLWAQTAAQRPPAKAIIQIWMWGGPSHLDMFDPKPQAGEEYSGPLKTPIPAKGKDFYIGELLPMLAQQADHYSIIRSMTHGVNAHETASYLMQTGHSTSERLVYPSLGAVVSMFKGYDHGYTSLIPPYVVLTNSLGRFSEVGFLGPRYKPFVTGGDPSKTPFAVEGIVAEGISTQRQNDRRELLGKLDSLGRAMPQYPEFEKFKQCQENAYELILGEDRKLFDLSTEKDSLRDQYGRSHFGQSCLAARRLIEHGVPFVAINYSGWDTHKQHFEIMRRKLPEFDKGLATLLQDLSGLGLLDSTIVTCYGEFGRTPKVQWESPWNGGRSHYGKCFSALVAGGGFAGGRVIGASDRRGEDVAERPVYPQDLLGSLYARLGINPDGPLPNPLGLEIPVMPAASKDGQQGGRLTEIL